MNKYNILTTSKDWKLHFWWVIDKSDFSASNKMENDLSVVDKK